MEISAHDDGIPSWIDLGAAELDKDLPFYEGLFGWDIPEGNEETGHYRTATLKGKPVAGLSPNQAPGAPPYWTTYVNVTSADDVAQKVADAGGQTFMAPMDVMEFGRMAIFADPTGAVFGVWQPGTHKGAEIVNEHGAYCWSELLTGDTEAAKAFYAAVFGWGAATSEGGGMAYTEWKVGDRSIGGMMPKPPSMPAEMPSHWAVYFAVDDLDASLEQARSLGATVLMDPIDSPAGRLAPVLDPAGAALNLIELVERYRD
jgi:uncharacterized protein